MTLQLLHSEFIYEENFILYFISVEPRTAAKLWSEEAIRRIRKLQDAGPNCVIYASPPFFNLQVVLLHIYLFRYLNFV